MREFAYKIRLIIAIIIFVSIISFGVFLFLNPQVLHNLPMFKIGLISVVTILLAALLFGRIGCSLVCPFGIFQEIVSLFFDRQNEKRPNWIGKYIILLLFFVAFGILAFKYKEITALNIPFMFLVFTFSLFVITGILSAFKDRIFCTHICPCGTLVGLLSKISLFKLTIDKEKCVCCGICERNCPSCSVESLEESIDNETCVKCLKCMSNCPKGAIGISFLKK